MLWRCHAPLVHLQRTGVGWPYTTLDRHTTAHWPRVSDVHKHWPASTMVPVISTFGLGKMVITDMSNIGRSVIACHDDKKRPKVITNRHRPVYMTRLCSSFKSDSSLFLSVSIALFVACYNQPSLPLHNGNPNYPSRYHPLFTVLGTTLSWPSPFRSTYILSSSTSTLSRLRWSERVRRHDQHHAVQDADRSSYDTIVRLIGSCIPSRSQKSGLPHMCVRGHRLVMCFIIIHPRPQWWVLLLELALIFPLKSKGWCSKVEISISLS